ncbi:MAG: hypothetical protein C0393_07160, partial [Anaerolinea sp.]|nr:hypothetical protein [Anaerolinea sp.]
MVNAATDVTASVSPAAFTNAAASGLFFSASAGPRRFTTTSLMRKESRRLMLAAKVTMVAIKPQAVTPI